jgi:DNA processing protein
MTSYHSFCCFIVFINNSGAMELTERQALVVLNGLPGMGPITLNRLLEAFHDPRAILEAPAKSLESVRGVGSLAACSIANWRNLFDLHAEEERLSATGTHIITCRDETYPSILQKIPDPPIALYVRGEIDSLTQGVAIVGTRNPTSYGRGVAHELAKGLASTGVLVISGLARGIDGVAHRAALEAGAKTIGVAGAGFDHVFPPEHGMLYDEVSQQGAVISEFRFTKAPDKQTFPIRNRIVAGLSRAVVVIESTGTGGAMITAHLAVEYGRSVLAVPGRIDQRWSEGPNRLIREGATLCRGIDDILQELRPGGPALSQGELPLPPAALPPPQDPDAATILTHLSGGAFQSADSLSDLCGIAVHEIQIHLLNLELSGHVRRRIDGSYEAMKGTSA